MRSDIMRAFKNKDGIALVVVLGMLAVLVVMGVAFSVSMRTERIATRSYMDVVKARHLVTTALYRVLAEDIVQEMSGRVYPQWDAYTASSAGNELPIVMRGNAFTGQPILFVPRSLWPATFPLGRDPGGVDWIELLDPVTGTFYGEYAFLVINNSGLLDANIIGAYEDAPRPRSRGIDPGEIRFNSRILPEARNPTLKEYRDEFRRFESVPELYYLTSTTTFQAQLNEPPPLRVLTNSYADHLHVFSRYPEGYARFEAGAWVATNVANISSATPWSNAVIENLEIALADLSPNPIPDVDAFIGVMQDYASRDYVLYPGSTNPDAQFNRISSMRVPMINEIAISNRLEFIANPAVEGSDLIRHTVFVSVETWYPFSESGPERFRVEFGEDNAGLPSVAFLAPPYPELNQPYTVVDGYPQPADFAAEPNSYQVTTFAFSRDQVVNDGSGPPRIFPDDGREVPFRTSYQINVPIFVRYLGGAQPLVDRVSTGWPDGVFFLNERISLPRNSPRSLGVVGASVNDPRINWDPRAAANQWSAEQVTLGQFNAFSVRGLLSDEVPSGATDRLGGKMYSRRGPFQSVSEISYLLYDAGRPWQTVRLLEPDPRNTAQIIDRISVYEESVRRGMVNVNTRQTNALAAAFWQMPIDRFPSETIQDGRWLTDEMALAVASEIIGGEPIANLSQLKSNLSQTFVDNQLREYDAANDKFVRESIVRNSLGLLGTRHNLFTIFVAARVFAENYDPNNAAHFQNREDFVLSDQRAVAVVWRDPFRTLDSARNQTYSSFVQYFHWLTGALED